MNEEIIRLIDGFLAEFNNEQDIEIMNEKLTKLKTVYRDNENLLGIVKIIEMRVAKCKADYIEMKLISCINHIATILEEDK